MKVKSLLLSMCAIAALASCSQNDDEITGGSNAPEAKVTIKFAGSEAATKADLGSGEAIVGKLTAFFFNSSGALIKEPVTPDLGTVSKPNEITLTTTTDATQVILVANAPEGTVYTGVTNIDKLKKVVISSLGATVSENTPVTQVSGKLTMSGWGKIKIAGDKRDAAVTLHFIAAKISKIAFNFTDADSKKHYAATEQALKDDATTNWFIIKRAYLMTAQTQSTLIPSTASETLWTGTFGPETGFVYAGGLKWGTDAWLPATGKDDYKVSSDYLNATFTAPASNSGAIGNVLGSKNLYVFENKSTEATAVVVEAICNIKDAQGVVSQKPRYFTVYFGEKNTGGNFATIQGGQDYTITLNANNSFDPAKGTGGGGTPDPTKPSVPADVTVTVTPATWTANATIVKDFN